MQVQKLKPSYKLVQWHFGKNHEIPEDWNYENLEKFTKIISGEYFAYSDFIESGIPVLKIDNVMHGKIDWTTKSFLPKKFLQQFEDVVLKEGDIVLALNRPITHNAVKVARLSNSDVPSLLYQRVGKFQFKKEKKIDERFFYVFLNSPNFKQIIFRILIGSDQPYLKTTELLKQKFRFPEKIIEQQKIASILSNCDSSIEQNQNLIEQTERLKKSMMQQLLTKGIGHTKFKKIKWYFGKEIVIPINWKLKKIVDIGHNFGDAPFGSMLKSVDYKENGIPILQGRNIKKNKFIWNQRLYVSKEKFLSIPRSHCNVGDLAFQKIGTIGAVAIIPKLGKNDTYLLSTNMMKMSTKKSEADIRFLYYLFTFNETQKRIFSIAKGNVQPIFNFTMLKQFKVLCPPIAEQQKIASILSKEDSKIEQITKIQEKTKLLKKGLLQKLLTGQIRVKI